VCFRRYDDADDDDDDDDDDDYAGDEPEIELPRGDVTEGVVRVGSTVRRPHQPGSPAVVAYLDHLERVGFAGAPRFLGRDRRGRDVLTFLDGAIAGDPAEPWAAADDLLAGVGALLRRLHDASEPWAVLAGLAFGRDLRGGSPLQLPAGPRLVSHNDVTPQNVVVRGGVAVGLIDFDLAGWTTRLVELANTGMHWVPLSDPVDRDPAYDGADIPRRLRLLVDSYGLDRGGRASLLDAFAVRLSGLYDRMHWNAENVGGGWARMWRSGVGEKIRRQESWFASQRPALEAALRRPTG
jgi:hypothetical protein